jgi:hypothetical protein
LPQKTPASFICSSASFSQWNLLSSCPIIRPQFISAPTAVPARNTITFIINELLFIKKVTLEWVSTNDQKADIFTKALGWQKVSEFLQETVAMTSARSEQG